MTAAEDLSREVFALAYHLSWSREATMSLPIRERREYLELLREQLERESRAVEEAAAP
jgi:hypothetical protein